MSLVAASTSSASGTAGGNPNEYDEGLTSDTIQKYKTAADIANGIAFEFPFFIT